MIRYSRKHYKPKNGSQDYLLAFRVVWQKMVENRDLFPLMLVGMFIYEMLTLFARIYFAEVVGTLETGDSEKLGLLYAGIVVFHNVNLLVSKWCDNIIVKNVHYILPQRLKFRMLVLISRLGAAFHTSVPQAKITDRMRANDKVVDLIIVVTWRVLTHTIQVLVSIGLILYHFGWQGIIPAAVLIITFFLFFRFSYFTIVAQAAARRRRKDIGENGISEPETRIIRDFATLNTGSVVEDTLNYISYNQKHEYKVGYEVEFQQEIAWPGGMRNVCLTWGRCAILGIAIYMANFHGWSVQNVVLLYTLTETTIAGTWGIGDFIRNLINSSESIGRLGQFLELKPMIEEPEFPETIPAGSLEIEFRNVTFVYPEYDLPGVQKIDKWEDKQGAELRKRLDMPLPVKSEQLLKGQINKINLVMKAGHVYGIVGTSGAGKSTLLKLIRRDYLPTQGDILINGVSIFNTSGKNVRTRIAEVLQRSNVFNDTLINNVTLENRANYTVEEQLAIVEVLKRAGLWKKVSGFKNLIHEEVGEGGEDLSGGERQRLAIARAMHRKPSLLILDEATSALDSETEAFVQEQIDRIIHDGAEDVTAIVIAHRLATLRNVDRIIVMDEGCVVEIGTWEELLSRNGVFARLWRAQQVYAEQVLN